MLGRTPIALLAGVFAIALGGCGSSDGTIPASDSQKLLGMLSQLQSYVSTGDCTLAEGTAADITAAVQALPDDVDPKVQTALTQGADNLATLTKDPTKCTDTGASGPEGVTTTDESTTTPTTTSTTTSTTETSTPEQTDETPPTGTPPGQGEQTPPTGNGDGNQGDGNGGAPTSGGVNPPGGKR